MAEVEGKQLTQKELQDATAKLSSQLIAEVFQSGEPFVVRMTALLTATIGFATTNIKAIEDETTRNAVAVHIAAMLLKGGERVIDASDTAGNK